MGVDPQAADPPLPAQSLCPGNQEPGKPVALQPGRHRHPVDDAVRLGILPASLIDLIIVGFPGKADKRRRHGQPGFRIGQHIALAGRHIRLQAFFVGIAVLPLIDAGFLKICLRLPPQPYHLGTVFIFCLSEFHRFLLYRGRFGFSFPNIPACSLRRFFRGG